jgi:hypothetical protein
MKLRTKMVATIVTAAAGLALFAGPTPARARYMPGPCFLPARTAETVRHHMKRIIRCAVDLWPVPGGAAKAICIADRESHLNPEASSRTGKYLGLFQHSAAAWPNRYTSYTRPEWKLHTSALNGRTNAIVTIRMVHAVGTKGWRPWAGAGC